MESLLKKVYQRPRLSATLAFISYIIVILTGAAYILLLVGAFIKGPALAVKVFLTTSLPFIIVSILRRKVNAPRPYELYDFYEHNPKRKSGESFPSRHAFSIFSIGTVCLFIYPIMGITLLSLGVPLAISRVLTGIHFTRDVVAGALIGAISALIGALIFTMF